MNRFLDIKDYFTIACLSKKYNKIATQYFSKFREIQYKLFQDCKYDQVEKHMLTQNLKYFRNHSIWIRHYINCMKYDVNLKLIENNSMFNYSRNCWKLMCSRNCKSCLQAEDSILLLYLCNKNKKLDEIILTPLRKIDVEEFSCYLMIFLEKLSGFFANIKKDFNNHFNDSLYIQLLFDKIKKDKKNELVFEIFWNLQYIKHSNKYCLLYDKFQNIF